MKEFKNRTVWTSPECLICLATIAFEILQKSTHNPYLQVEGMRKTYEILQDFSITSLPTDIANRIYYMIQELTHNIDPFKEIKIQSNKLAKDAIKRIRDHVLEPTTPQVRFRRALAAAIAGNLIDFGTAGHSIDLNGDFLEKAYYQIIKDGFAIDHSDTLFSSLKKGMTALYIGDNAGEIFFDLFLIDQVKKAGLEIILVVKGTPISNDATMEDIEEPLFNEIVDKIITTGTGTVGVSPTESSQEFLNYLQTADCIIAKGQSNFETLYYYQKELTNKPIYFIFRTKCASIAQFLGQRVGKNIVLFKKI